MRIKVRGFNPQILLEFLCCCLFAGLLAYLVRSGKYLSYVTPRMKPYLYFSAIVMAIWALAGTRRLFQPQHRIRSAHCLVLAVPILLILLPHAPLGVSEVTENYTGKGIYMPSDKQSGQQLNQQTTQQPDQLKDEQSDALPGLDMENKKITVSNEDFATWLAEFDFNGKRYEGYTIVMTGFVFNDFDVSEGNEFVVSRLAMTCCIADVSPTGVQCIYDKASELQSESWVTVEGTLFIGKLQYNNITREEPQIHVVNITAAEPVEGYVYPFV